MNKIKKTIYVIKTFWLIVGITFALFAFLESLLSFMYFMNSRLNPESSSIVDSRINADVYKNTTEISSYFKEFNESNIEQWHPYTYWRRQPFHGQLINIDNFGRRFTTNYPYPLSKSKKIIKIFVFGGSTVWGTGVSDSSTIPSLLNIELYKKGINSQVTNFGESGYVSTQELIMLMQELKSGNMPDFVIFYDGINDIFSAYQQRIAGITINEFNRVKEFNITDSGKSRELYMIALKEFINSLHTVKTTKYFLRKLHILTTVGDIKESYSLENNKNLIDDLTNNYKNNISIANNLAKLYGFKCWFYWQPTLFDKNIKTNYENKIFLGQDTVMIKFYKNVYSLITDNNKKSMFPDNFRNLSLIFRNINEPLYIDWMHLGVSGNQIVAKIISRDIINLFKY